jgi:hypothetical protein
MRAPLVPARYTDLFISTSQLEKPIERLANIRKAMPLLPRANYIMLERLACLFHIVAESGTGPTAEELAALFALVLIWPPASATADSANDDSDQSPASQHSSRASELILTVSVPSMQMSSKMRFSPSMTAADALNTIYKKIHKLDSNLQYRLWLPPPKNIFAEPDSVLQQFALREGDVIVVKQQGAAVPPYYQMAAADLWLAVIEEYRFLFANGAARFTAAVHRVPVAHGVQSANASVGGFRRRDVITAEKLESEIDSALSSQAADGGGGGALSPNLRRQRQAQSQHQPPTQQAPPAKLMSQPSVGFSSLSPRGMTVAQPHVDVGQGFNPLLSVSDRDRAPLPSSAVAAPASTPAYTQQDFLDLQFAFGGLDDDVLRDALTQCGSLRAATEFLQSQSDEVDAQRVLYNTMQLDVNHRPAPPLPKGATPHISALSSSSAGVIPSTLASSAPVGSQSASHFGAPLASGSGRTDSPNVTLRQRPAVPEKPAYLSKHASLPAVVPPPRTQSSSPTPDSTSSSGRSSGSPGVALGSTGAARRPELGLNASKPDLFKEIAYLNSEIRRLTADNRELVSNMDSNAAMRTLQTQIDEMSAQLDEVKERCTCGAARYRMVK